MEIQEKKLKTTDTKLEKQIQITLDEDKNVPDSKLDIERIILSQADMKLQETEVMVDRIRVTGELEGKLLYFGTDGNSRCSVMDFSIPFEEYFHMTSVVPTDRISIIPEVEDLNITLINSRKIGIRAILNFYVVVTNVQEMEVISKAEGDGVQILYKNIGMTQLMVDKKDIVRLREEVSLPVNKPNIYEILWSHVEFQKLESKIYDEKIGVQGELYVFLLYHGEEDNIPLQYVEWQLPFQTQLPCSECKEEMIGSIGYRVLSKNIETKPDADGETRILSIETGLELDLKVYEEEQLQILDDVYHWKKELLPQYKSFVFEHLIVKNAAAMRLSHKIPLTKDRDNVLQILYMDGICKMDDIQIIENGVLIEGVIDGNILYLTNKDNIPISSLPVVIPFSYMVEAKGISKDDHYLIHACLDQMNASFLDGDAIEVKVEVTFDMLVLSSKEENAMVKIEEQQIDLKELQKMPGIIGYIAQPEDTLWKIAKQYHTTIDSMRRLNPDLEEEIKAGDRILIVKEIEESFG